MDTSEAENKEFDGQVSTSSFMEMLRAGTLTPERVLSSSILSTSPGDVKGSDVGGSDVVAVVQQQQQQQQQPEKSKGRPAPSPFNRPEESDGAGDDNHDDHADFIADHSNLEIPSSLLFEAGGASSPLPSPASKGKKKKRKKRKHTRRPEETCLPPGLDTSTEPSTEPSTDLSLPVREITGRSPDLRGGFRGSVDIDELIASTRKAVEIDEVDDGSGSNGGAYSLVEQDVTFYEPIKERGLGNNTKEGANRPPSLDEPEGRATSNKAKEHWKTANLMNQVLATFNVSGRNGESENEESTQLQLRDLEVRPTASTLQNGMKMRRESDMASPPTVRSDEGADHSSSQPQRSAGGRMLDFVTKRVGRRSRGSSADGAASDITVDENSEGSARSTTFNSKIEGAKRFAKTSARKSITKLKNGGKRLSMVDVLGQAKKKEEQEEIQASVEQFRNPIFDSSIARASGSIGVHQSSSFRLRNGIYRSRSRMRRGSVVPEDIMDISKIKRDDVKTGKKIMDVVISPQEREKPKNVADWVWDRNSTAYQRFYLLTIFLVIVEVCVLPYQFVFIEKGGKPTHPAPYFFNVMHFAVTCVYIVDVYLSFHLTYVDKKSEVVYDLNLIRQHYMSSGRFLLDIISAIPFDFVRLFSGGVADQLWWASYVKLIKTFRLLKVLRFKRLSDNQTVLNLGRIVWVLILFTVVMHVMACWWYHISVMEERWLHNNHSWMRSKFEDILAITKQDKFLSPDELEQLKLDDYTCDINGNRNEDLGGACFTPIRQYLISLYTVMMILMQDAIEPTSSLECLFAVVFGMFGMVVGAVLVGQTADIIRNLHRAEARYNEKMDDVAEQLRNLDVSKDTRGRVFEYLEYTWTVNKGLNRDQILAELSDNLRSEVLVAVHGDVIRKIPLFDIEAIPELLVHIVSKLKSSYYLPGDVIVHEKEKTVETSCMYFIVHGNVAVYHMKEPNNILGFMTKGEFFGEIAYLARGSRRTASLCAASNSDIASLRFVDIDHLQRLFPEMKARMDSEVKKHMAVTEEGKRYLEAEMNMGKISLGSIVFHATRGEGVVVFIDEHKRRHVQFKNGDIHKYLPTSWHKMKLLKMGDGPKNVWNDKGKEVQFDRRETQGSLTNSKKHIEALKVFAKNLDVKAQVQTVRGDTRKIAMEDTPKRKVASFKFGKKFLLSHRRKTKGKKEETDGAPSPFKLRLSGLGLKTSPKGDGDRGAKQDDKTNASKTP